MVSELFSGPSFEPLLSSSEYIGSWIKPGYILYIYIHIMYMFLFISIFLGKGDGFIIMIFV